ncbi:MAG: phenylalanine--tRNA ligase subunit beta [Myxococcales bacterium]|nr:phenylalanine--tRNA ligase subunit beta [Myxococcota bacterium]MDW8283908.1 phenylalanine--tRNA ligase subunit beta [Myxococcales bacterium]
MLVSHTWLRQLVELPADVGWQEIARRLTLGGIEVEGTTPVAAELAGVVVAEVRACRPHPQADRLTLVDVFDGEQVVQVVCGAPNVPSPGQPGRSPRVLWARPGARLPGGVTVGVRQVRGVASPGMLCAEDELGLSEDHSGIVVLSPEDGLEVGSDFAAAVGLPDVVLELNVMANRPDCLGHVGVAREVAALFRDVGARLRLPQPDPSPWFADLPLLPVELCEPAGCPRYTARILHGVRVRPSPLRLRLLLRRLGLRAISNVVDATNLAMLEWGQPLHAFDLHRIEEAIVVRRAEPGELLRTLDGQQRQLTDQDLLIADRKRGLAIAGIMGGQDSEVSAETTAIVLESAYFTPAWVRRTARRLRLHSESSHRFERGVDPNAGVELASARCAELILQLGGGQVSRCLLDVYPHPVRPRVVALRPARTRALLGTDWSDQEQIDLLAALGLSVAWPLDSAAPQVLAVTVPTFRPDLTREVDLIEEVGRLAGYHRIPATLPPLRLGGLVASGAGRIADRARDLACALGLDEIQTFAFVSPARLRALGFVPGDRRAAPLLLENPLREELSALRTQLVLGLLEALRHNLSHGETELRLFEVGEVFLPGPAGAAPEERPRIAGVLCGHRDHWLAARPADELDFSDVRGVVEELMHRLGLPLVELPGTPGALHVRAARPGEAPWLHPGIAAVLVDESGQVRGELGEVHPDLREALGIEVRAFAFEIDLPEQEPPCPRFQPLPRFPAVSRDLSFFVDEAIPAGQVLGVLRRSGEPLLVQVRLLEDYREPGRVPPGKKGLLLSLLYRSSERTLTDEEVRRAHEAVVRHLQAQLEIVLR